MGFVAIFACLVPLRLLYRNKEFAAIVFVVNDLGLCLINTINALIWHDDNMDNWYTGFGWCDLHPYLYVPMMTLFTTSVLAHSRGMAEKVSLVRASPMTKRERRRNYLMQSLIMFPLPIVQLAWMYPLTAQRFVLTTLVGCDWRVDGSWPWLTFFILPIPILSIIAGIYAFITWRRYRVLRKSTRGVFAADSAATARSNRTGRRLYLLTLTILIPYVPISCAFAALNISQNIPIRGFNFHKIHFEAEPFPWNSVLLVPSTELPFVFLNAKYIPIFSGLLILFFFGGTQDAINDYRRVLVALGLGRIFPILYEEYHRDKPVTDLRTITVDSDDDG
ncbi:pheromone receptor [Plectosphaerella cucumerina]|uniref:Pheromone receptor n=1 Tax=Plectosphaerella cucumerina TaxID=40658 RepID=A0A8K0T5Y8_9PEZI|nr:pheromone receptor [Plectosphaerella cucumerina]